MTRVTGFRLSERLSRMSNRRFKATVYLTALALYLTGIWLHLPYNGGYVYTDLTQLLLYRLWVCPPPSVYQYEGCTLSVPYLQSFNEYPVLTSMFMYVMAVLGGSLPWYLPENYFLLSAAVLTVPAFLAIRELMKIIELRGVSRSRVLWYFVVTPTFVFMTLLNWYAIGVYFTLYGMRKYLEGGSKVWSGVVFGLSAASNFVTAIPALGFFIASKTTKEKAMLAGAALGTYGAINAPFIFLNSALWLESFRYIYAWNIEDSWMQAILIDLNSPYRHLIPPIVFGGFIVGMLWLRYRAKTSDPLVFAFVATFGYTFSTYVNPPQLNLILLPFFVLLPVSSRYLEFLAFEIVTALIIILGFSEVLLPFGMLYRDYFMPVGYMSAVFWVEVIRSVWQGKFALLNRVPGSISLPGWRRETSRLTIAGEKDVAPP